MQNEEKIKAAIAECLDQYSDTLLNPMRYLERKDQLVSELYTAIAPHLGVEEPDWSNAPEWAHYLAMDANGYWWWYSEKPQLSRGIWAFGGERAKKSLHRQDIAWYESLQSRPQ